MTEPRNLGPDVNTKGYDFDRAIADGQYLFFTRDEGGTGNVHLDFHRHISFIRQA